MRIEAFNQIQQAYKSTYTGRTENKVPVSKSDKLQISNAGKDIYTVKQALANTADIREDIVAPLKERIKNGTYEVSAASFADRLAERYAEMR